MKKLGIIGGAGPLASSLFYETLIHECYRLGIPLPEIILLNYPFTRGLTLQEGARNKTSLQKELGYCLDLLKEAGAELCVVICNTLHLILPSSPLFLSIPEIVAEEVKKKKHHHLLLLGTQNTLKSSLYSKNGFQILLPNEREQRLVNHVIDHVLEGKILEKDSLLISQLIQSYSEKIDGVILGCTDLPVLHHHYPLISNKTLFDSVKIPAKTLIGAL